MFVLLHRRITPPMLVRAPYVCKKEIYFGKIWVDKYMCECIYTYAYHKHRYLPSLILLVLN